MIMETKTIEEFKVICEEIARGIGYRLVQQQDTERNCFWIEDDKGHKIMLSENYYSYGRLTVVGIYPRDMESRYVYPDRSSVDITISLAKDIDTIIGDIRKRFMNKYLENYRNVEQKVKIVNEYYEKKKNKIKEISDYIGVELDVFNKYSLDKHSVENEKFSSLRVTVSGDFLDVEICNISVETVKKIWDILR